MYHNEKVRAPVKLLTVGSLPPEWGGPRRGGVATFHAALLSGLLERDDVEPVGVLPPELLSCVLPLPVFERPEDIDRASFYEELLETLRPEVVLMNHVANTVGVTHARLSSRIPALGVIHSWHNVTDRSGEERRRATALTEEAIAGLSAVAVPSRYALDEGRELGFRYPQLAEAIHYPLPPLYMAEDVDPSTPERRGVVFLGSLVPRKSPAALVEAMSLLPGVSALLVGEGELEADLRALVDRLALGDRVRLAGALPGAHHLARVRDALLHARGLCLPSRSESFGIVFIEALACGTPIVGFGPTVREIQEATGVEVGVALEGDDPEEVAAAIDRVLSAEWDRDLLRRATLDAFSLPRVTGLYVDLLRRTVVSE